MMANEASVLKRGTKLQIQPRLKLWRIIAHSDLGTTDFDNGRPHLMLEIGSEDEAIAGWIYS